MSTSLLYLFEVCDNECPSLKDLMEILNLETEIKALEKEKERKEARLRTTVENQCSPETLKMLKCVYENRKNSVTDLLKKRGFTDKSIFKAADYWHRSEYSDFYALDFEDQVSEILSFQKKFPEEV